MKKAVKYTLFGILTLAFFLGTGLLYRPVRPDFDAMAEFVCNNTSAGDIVITMGAGDIYKVGELILEKAQK